MKAPAKTRTSLRQAEARIRISQIDNPSDSAPPFEETPTMPGWDKNPSRSVEREYIEAMVEHLRDDPLVYDDLLVLRFVYKEWPLLQHSISTKLTVEMVKKRLLDLQVRYLRFTANQDWMYWNDYTEEGILAFLPTQDSMDMVQQDISEVSKTPGIMDQARQTPDTAVHPSVLRTRKETTHTPTASVNTLSTSPAQLDAHKTSSIDTDEESDYRKMSQGSVGYPTQMEWRNQPTNMVDTHNTMDFGTPVSSTQSGVDSPLLTPRSSPRIDRQAEAHALTTMQPMRSPDVIDLLSPESQTLTPWQKADQDEGFITVVPRNSSQRKSIQTKLPWSTPKTKPSDRQSTPGIREGTRKPVPPIAPPPVQKQIQIDTFSEILQDRVSEVLSRIEQSETTSLIHIKTQMELLQNCEANWQATQNLVEERHQAHEDRMIVWETKLQQEEAVLHDMYTEIQESLRLVRARKKQCNSCSSPSLHGQTLHGRNSKMIWMAIERSIKNGRRISVRTRCNS